MPMEYTSIQESVMDEALRVCFISHFCQVAIGDFPFSIIIIMLETDFFASYKIVLLTKCQQNIKNGLIVH